MSPTACKTLKAPSYFLPRHVLHAMEVGGDLRANWKNVKNFHTFETFVAVQSLYWFSPPHPLLSAEPFFFPQSLYSFLILSSGQDFHFPQEDFLHCIASLALFISHADILLVPVVLFLHGDILVELSSVAEGVGIQGWVMPPHFITSHTHTAHITCTFSPILWARTALVPEMAVFGAIKRQGAVFGCIWSSNLTHPSILKAPSFEVKCVCDDKFAAGPWQTINTKRVHEGRKLNKYWFNNNV